MKLRRKLICLLAAFAVFTVAATTLSIYAIQRHIDDAVTSFHDWMARSTEVSNLRVAAREHLLSLGEAVQGRRPITETFRRSHDQFYAALEGTVADASRHADPPLWSEIAALGAELRSASDQCLALAEAGRHEDAEALWKTSIAEDLAPRLESRLRAVQPAVEEWRRESVTRLIAAKTRVLILATALAVFAGGLVLAGGVLIGRWLIGPIAELQLAAEQFRLGRLDHRAAPRSGDELGQLAASLNTMAASLAQARGELHTSEAKYRSLFENLRDAVVLCDVGGGVVECHDGDTRLLGCDGPAAVGRPLLSVWPAWRGGSLDWPAVIERVARTGELFRADDVELAAADPLEENPPRADVAVYPVEYGQARHVAILLRDGRERQRLQRRIRQAEKMQAVGTLAGGVAHDFNNLLTSAIGALSLVDANGLVGKNAARVKTALRACWQAAGLSRRLLRFAHGGQARPQRLKLAEMVEVILGSLDESFFNDIQIQPRLDGDVVVIIDKDELTQVVLNLLSNARDAVGASGVIEITVDRAEQAPADAALSQVGHGGQGGPFARLTVRDNGVGMTPQVRQRLFEPFFTTKTRTSRRGTGLGLAVAYSVVRGAGGAIEVESEPGKGATLRVYLPAASGPDPQASACASVADPPSRHRQGTPEPQACGLENAAQPQTGIRQPLPAGGPPVSGDWHPVADERVAGAEAPAAAPTVSTHWQSAAGPLGPGGCILLVDDDPMVLHTCTDILENLGFAVIAAEGVADAQAKFAAAAPGAIRLALIDLALSDGSGVDLATALSEKDSGLTFILMTGYRGAAVPPALRPRVLAELSKPFRAEDLRALLADKSPSPSV